MPEIEPYDGMGPSAPVSRKDSRMPVQNKAPLITGWRLLGTQFAALVRKNLLIRALAWRTNVLLLAQAVLFILLIWGVDRALTASRQRQPAYSSQTTAEAVDIGPIPDCATNIYLRQDRACYTIAYAPKGVALVEEVLAAVADNNSPPIPRTHLKGFASETEIDDYLLANPETVLSAVILSVDGERNVAFTIQVNSSVQWFKGDWQHPNTYVQLPLQAAVERELVRRAVSNPDLEWSPALTQFPHPAAKSPSMIGTIAPTFLFASIMFQFVLLLHDVVHEEESGVRRAMATMGLRDSPFWASWFLYEGTLAVIEGSLLVGFGYAFKFTLLTGNAFGLGYLLLILVSLAMTSFGFFLSTFMNKAAAAVPVGFVIFVVAWICLIVIAFDFPYSAKYGPAGMVIFSLFPWSLLSKGVGDLAAAASGSTPGGIPWSMRGAYCVRGSLSPEQSSSPLYYQDDCVMPLGTILWVLALQCIGYCLLALYFDNVLPDCNGVRRAPWYFLQPSYWVAPYKPSLERAQRAYEASTQESTGLVVDADVAEEMERMKTRCLTYTGKLSGTHHPGAAGVDTAAATPQPAYAMEMYGLRKEYGRGLFRRKPFVAVRSSWLGVLEGDALVYGTSIASSGGMARTRPIMGVCPQFDVLWDELTGLEHLHVFAAIKGIPAATRAAEAAKLLEEVKLTEAGSVRAGAYSGGMRRRLSVAMALLGDPKLVFLDEPTTGLDPISRRHLWDLIDSCKRQRAIVLTTHSMEEADILGDRQEIGIMARGRLRCIGTSLRLKMRFGSGYRISIRVQGGTSSSGSSSQTEEGALDGDFLIPATPTTEAAADSAPRCKEQQLRSGSGEEQRSTLGRLQAARIKAVFADRLGVTAADESLDYVHFMCPYENEDKLPSLFHHLKVNKLELGVADLQLRLTPLEDVFLTITRKAELEHAQAEGRFEMLTLTDEGMTIKVPIGADFIQSPSGTLYHIRWSQDGEGQLHILEYWADPVSKLLAAVSGPLPLSFPATAAAPA
ncbi:ABC transporter A family member 2 [Auxenochlorella protothecoides]|uniref:ABC transporter A family member 2 n=1 Tax=Auxenochlorella protothecoides TaxID=3075 RepID=A0A087SS55_AUXPR|nr:ABC transporter A family member 2 [Auxenochlorella protothecoides]KFM28559.1 ABC transporter A family member 2 [Auxenochlorella protothecoides]RMZ53340.1 hypothetical protein APUTEX25_004828 [Auxenochlorella protothecoides]|eukprot:RMZ53340.1 hypothetical protein APUTEX25_004828 [Auxenochlorella protothecoides]